MIVTDEAKQELREILLSKTGDTEICLRVVRKSPSELGLALDRVAEGDQIIKYQDTNILLIGRDVADFVDSLKLDLQDTPEGKRLFISD